VQAKEAYGSVTHAEGSSKPQLRLKLGLCSGVTPAGRIIGRESEGWAVFGSVTSAETLAISATAEVEKDVVGMAVLPGNSHFG